MTASSASVGEGILALLILGIFTGALIITGGALLNSDSPGRRKSGGILSIAMMVIGAVFTLGGLLIGFILVLIGSVIGLTYKGEPDVVVGVTPMGPAWSAPVGESPTAQRPVKFCIKCGSALYEGAVFCGVCGAPIPT
ncbi:MAG: zinc ribbon domain-containing protein [Nitrososphaerales archaeon]